GHRIGQSRRSEQMAKHAFDDQRKAEREEQTVEMVELIEPLQKKPLDHDAAKTHRNRNEDKRPPIAKPRDVEEKVGGKCAQHILGAVREADDVEHAENDGKSEAKQCIERSVDHPDEQLAEERLRRDAEKVEHPSSTLSQWTFAFRERPECFVLRNGGTHLVVVPRRLRLGRGLDLEQIHRVNLASVSTHAATTEQPV